MKAVCNLLLIFLISCSFGRHGVYLNEMQKAPVLTLKETTLEVKTFNSIHNSALIIYDVKAIADNQKKNIFLSAQQGLRKHNKNYFEIDLIKLNVLDPLKYSFYWRDPNKVDLKLVLTNNQ